MTRQVTYLVVSDDPELLERLRGVAQAAAATVIATGDALEARRLAATVWPDVILTAEVGPGIEWLRTLPQVWDEMDGGQRPHLPAGVRAFAVAARRM